MLDKYPTIPVRLEPIWAAFTELHTSRQIGISVCPIALSDILAYCQLMGYLKETGEYVYRMIKALDLAFLDWDKKRELENRKCRRLR